MDNFCNIQLRYLYMACYIYHTMIQRDDKIGLDNTRCEV